MDKRYQVFISSTYEDLKHERDAVIKAVLEMGHFPVGMEMFNAADEEQWVTIQREIDRSDYYLLIVAHRYGSTIAAEGGISYTEKEFDYAVSTNVPRIGFVIDKGVSWEPTFVDQGKQKKRLDQFKTKVKGRPVDFWKSRDDLATKVVLSLGKLIANTNRPGWQRGNGTTEEVAGALARLAEDNSRLREENAQLKLLTDPKTQLKFYFADERGNSLGDSLPIDLADENAYDDHLSHAKSRIRSLLQNYSPILNAPLNENNLSSEFMKVHIDHLRIENVKALLNAHGMSFPADVHFGHLYRPRTSSQDSHKRNEPTRGLDFDNYTVFNEIEKILETMHAAAEAHARRKNTFEYRIDCQNIGRVAAERLQIRIRPEAHLLTLAGTPKFADLDPEVFIEDRYIDLIVPHENSLVLSKTVLKSLASGEVIINIKALAKNLPEPQESQLKIVFDGSRPPTIVR